MNQARIIARGQDIIDLLTTLRAFVRDPEHHQTLREINEVLGDVNSPDSDAGLPKPFTPAQAKAEKVNTIPWMIIEATNQLLAEKHSNYIRIDVDEIIKRAISLDTTNKLKRADIFKNHWMDIEDVYRAQGWSVSHDSSDYTDSHSYSYFTFKKAR
jgi:hypothetical protein